MTISLSLSVSPGAPAAGQVITAVYAVSGDNATPGAVVATSSGEVTIAGTEYEEVTTISSLGAPAAAVTYAAPVCSGLTFAKTAQPNVFTATAGATFGTTVSGSAAVGGTTYSATAALSPAAPIAPPPPSGTVPYPAALATGHTLIDQYLPSDLYAWRYVPGTQTPVTNGSGVSENPDSPRNVTLATDGGLSVIQLATTSDSDCGIIQSPGTYPTSSGVIETLVKFSGFTYEGVDVFAAWAAFWLYGANWPGGGEVDAVETSYGNSYVSYHYGTNGQNTEATTNPWTYAAKKVQLQPENNSSVPAAPNILPDTWTYVTLAFGKDAGGNYLVDVYYDGVLYCTIDGPYVTGDPMYITAGTGFGGPVLGSSQTPYDQPGNIEIQYIRVFS
jgi:hypothetical protein